MSYQRNIETLNRECDGNTLLIEPKQRDPDEEYEKERDRE